MQQEHNLTDEMIAGRRPDSHGHLPEDMPRWMSHTIVAIDTLEPMGRTRGELADAAADVRDGLRGHRALLLHRADRLGLRHQPHDLRRDVHARRGLRAFQGRAHPLGLSLSQAGRCKRRAGSTPLLYVVCYFPAMLIFLWVVVASGPGRRSSRGERGTDTAFMPLLGPVKSCAADRHRVPDRSRASPSC